MELNFKTETLRKKCETWKIFKKDAYMNRKLILRLTELDHAPNLLEIKKKKNLYNLHPLKGNRKYELSIDIDGRKNVFRIIFETNPREIVCDDFLNDELFKQVTKITILEITDKTH